MSTMRIAPLLSRLNSITAALAIVATLGLSSTVACSQAAGVKAMITFKQANQAYQQADYKRAAQLYETTIQSDPTLAQAIQNYQLAAEKLSVEKPADAKLKKLALEYLVAGYGPDKLNDPAKAEP